VTSQAPDEVLLTSQQLRQMSENPEEIQNGGDPLPASKRGSVINFQSAFFQKWDLPIMYKISEDFGRSSLFLSH
jgi:hypothetical protein